MKNRLENFFKKKYITFSWVLSLMLDLKAVFTGILYSVRSKSSKNRDV